MSPQGHASLQATRDLSLHPVCSHASHGRSPRELQHRKGEAHHCMAWPSGVEAGDRDRRAASLHRTDLRPSVLSSSEGRRREFSQLLYCLKHCQAGFIFFPQDKT